MTTTTNNYLKLCDYYEVREGADKGYRRAAPVFVFFDDRADRPILQEMVSAARRALTHSRGYLVIYKPVAFLGVGRAVGSAL